jgi:raffinose/stachyose/melibiose transport system substrate-binding protein
MKYSVLFSQASYESTSGSVSAETVVKILYPVAIPKSVEIWQSAAVDYEKEHPETKIEFDYLENEEFKAKLPTLLESNDPPSVFFSRGGGVALEQIQAGLWQDITSAHRGGFQGFVLCSRCSAFHVSRKIVRVAWQRWSNRSLV